MTNSTRSDMDALREEMNALRSDIGAIAATLKDMTVNTARSAGGAASENLEELRQRLDRVVEEARARGRAASETIQQEIEHRPFTSLLIAFAVGVVISRLLDRR